MTKQQRGTLFVFLASICYSLGGICMKGIPWSGMAVNGGRTAIAVVVMGIYLLLSRQKLRFNRWILLGALAVSLTNILFAVANKMTTAANAIVLQYTAPIFVIVLTAIFLHKRPGRLDLAACALVFGGVLCFFVESLSGGSLTGDMLALISGVTYAVVFMLNDLPDGDALSAAFFGHVISAVVGLPFVLQQTQFGTTCMVSLLVLGVFQVGFAFIFLGEGLKTTPAVTASLVSGLEPVLNPILVALFYPGVDNIGLISLVGAVIVVGGVIGYNVLLAKQEQKTVCN
ncbi:MAG: EamA family transporter [Oscillospiraceae bacterium]|nr:EamA family transporter [Oscillospiraceae bacterium]